MRILVIDDDDLVRHSLAEILESSGYEVVMAPDGERGMAVLHDARPDLVITDMLTPEQEGISTIRQIRSENPATRIIAISGRLRMRDFDVLGMARKFGADDAFAKPFDPGQLLHRIRELLHPAQPAPERFPA